MVEQPTGSETSGSESGTDRIHEAAGQAREQATRVVDQIRDHAQSLANEKKTAAADQISGFASALRKTADDLGEQDYGIASEYVGRAASGLEEFSGTIRDRDFSSLLGDIEDCARRYPSLFLGGTVVAGFLFARFLKSTREDDGMDLPQAEMPDEPHPPPSAASASTAGPAARRPRASQGRAGGPAGNVAGTSGIGGMQAPPGSGPGGGSP